MIYLISNAGNRNYGDEMILRQWLNFYRQLEPNMPIIVDCCDKDKAAALHRGFRNVSFVSCLKKLCHGKEQSYIYYVDRAIRFVNSNWNKWINSLSKRSDGCKQAKNPLHLHLLGGGYINGNWKNSISLLAAAYKIKKDYGARIFATGLGVDPIKAQRPVDRRLLSNIIRLFDFFELRDFFSYQQIVSIVGDPPNIIHGMDDLFLNEVGSQFYSSETNSLHISVFKQALPKIDANSLKTLRCSLSDDKASADVYFWQSGERDSLALPLLSSIFHDLKVLSLEKLLDGAIPINKNDVFLSARMHPHLFGLRSNIRGGYISTSDYYKRKHHALHALGSYYPENVTKDTVQKILAPTNIRFFCDSELVSLKNKTIKALKDNVWEMADRETIYQIQAHC